MDVLTVDHESIQHDVIERLNGCLDKWHRPSPLKPIGLQDGLYPPEIEAALGYIKGQELGEADLFRLGIVASGPRLLLTPVGISEFTGEKGILVHQGFVDSHNPGGFDNLSQLENEGIFGNQAGATYLAPLSDIRVIQNFTFPEDRPRRVPVVAYINPGELSQRRLVYIDPEQQMEHREGSDIPRNAIFIIGGIPAEAIIHFYDKVDPNLF